MFTSPGSRGGPQRVIPRGSILLFFNPTAPVGWTKLTTNNDRTIRIVSGAGGATGGTNSFSSTFVSVTSGNTTLSASQIPLHTHFATNATHRVCDFDAGAGVQWLSGTGAQNLQNLGATETNNGSTTSVAPGGGSHNHTVDMRVQYVDAIQCVKN